MTFHLRRRAESRAVWLLFHQIYSENDAHLPAPATQHPLRAASHKSDTGSRCAPSAPRARQPHVAGCSGCPRDRSMTRRCRRNAPNVCVKQSDNMKAPSRSTTKRASCSLFPSINHAKDITALARFVMMYAGGWRNIAKYNSGYNM